jgi:hypothetical protein
LNGCIEKEKFKNNITGVLLHRDPGKIGRNAVAWDGPTNDYIQPMKRLRIRIKKDLDLAERMRKLLEALPYIAVLQACPERALS